MKKLNQVSSHSVASGEILCGRIGKSTDKIALGSSDRSVYIHSRSRGCDVRFPDHPTGVESVGFDKSDSSLVAGCSGGSVWLWDVGKESQITSLAGHRSNCTVVEFHPFGSFFASGSLDTNVKIWDQRQSKCAQTYRSHSGGVSAVKFSPHGRWLVSGDSEGVLKVWDLSAGKELTSLESHTGSIWGLDFHPTDFFLVSGSAGDRTVKLWNCESGFALAATSDPELSPVKSLKFIGAPQEGEQSLLVATNHSVKVFSLDSDQRRISCIHSHESIPFSNLLDIAPISKGSSSNLMVAVSSNGASTASVWSNEGPEPSPRDLKSGGLRERIAAAKRSNFGDEFVLVEKRDEEHVVVRTPSMLTGSRLTGILENRLAIARSVSSQWMNGNSRSAIETSLKDVSSFISLLAILPFERTRTALSVDSCTTLLNHIVSLGLLTLPKTPSDSLAENFASTPFSLPVDLRRYSPETPTVDLPYIVSTSLNCVTYLAKRFGPILSDLKKASQLPATPGTDVSREERTAKALACFEVFENVMDLLSHDAKSCKILRREKQEAVKQILSLIQP